jgi:hypothetical protein
MQRAQSISSCLRRFGARLLLALSAGALVLAVAHSARADAKGDKAAKPAKRAPKLTMRVVAPSPQGPWLLQIDNDDDQPLRIAADVRLLSLDVSSYNSRTRRWGRSASCNGPKAFGFETRFPADRELLLEPGNRYQEKFDPRLICFGKQARLLKAGAQVTPRYGFRGQSKWAKKSRGPYVVDGTKLPRSIVPKRRISGPPVFLVKSGDAPPTLSMHGRSSTPPEMIANARRQSDARDPRKSGHKKHRKGRGKGERGKGEGGKSGDAKSGEAKGTAGSAAKRDAKRPRHHDHGHGRHDHSHGRHRGHGAPHGGGRGGGTIDELGARMALTSVPHADAKTRREIALSVEAHNTGDRPVFVALRARQLEFFIEGPDGIVHCPRRTLDHRVPRDLFRSLDSGQHIHMHLMLAEMCPAEAFQRPGLYLATPILHADATGQEYGLKAMTGVVTTRDPGDVGGTHRDDDDATLVRVRFGRLRFHRKPPRQRPVSDADAGRGGKRRKHGKRKRGHDHGGAEPGGH